MVRTEGDRVNTLAYHPVAPASGSDLYMKRTIVIMAKAPVAGEVKTRLRDFLSAEQCAKLAECFLQDTIDKVAALEIPIIIAYAPGERRAMFEKYISPNIQLIEQKGEALGERMSNVFRDLLAQNIAVTMVGADSPTFPADYIRRAFAHLEEDADAVLGKTLDGGFYLIALRKWRPEILENIHWSSSETYRQTIDNIEKMKFRLHTVPDWYDVDVKSDLYDLNVDLLNNSSTAPQTAEFLKSLTFK